MTDTATPRPRPKRTLGWYNLPGLGRIETETLVTRIRKFRGRKTIHQILVALGITQTKYTWLSIRNLCREYEISVSGPDDPEYYTTTILRDRAMDTAAENLRRQIALAKQEQASAPRYKPGKLEW